MNIVELKSEIENNSLNDSFLILKWSDTNFIAKSYTYAIARNKDLKIKYIDSLDECDCSDNDFFNEITLPYLNVLIADEFKSELEDFDKYTNTIVICKKCEVKNEKYVVNIPKLEKWQIEDYMKMCCKGVNENKLKWLQTISNNDIDRIDNEVSKLTIFEKEYQDEMFNLLNDEGGYGDLSSSDFFDLVNAFKQKDKDKILVILTDIDNIDVEPMGLVTMLLKEFNLIANIKCKEFRSTKDKENFFTRLKITSQRYSYYKNTICINYNKTQLVNILSFLCDVDYDLKMGNLGPVSVDKYRFIDYIICGVLSS